MRRRKDRTPTATQRDNADPWVRRRMYIAAGVLTFLFVCIGYKAYGLQIERGDYYKELARRQHLRKVAVPAPRGAVYDATGRELAVTAEVDSISADPRRIRSVAATADVLARVLGCDVRELEAKLSSRRHFVWVKRHVTEAQARTIRDLKLKGVEITKEPRRYYPGGKLAGTLIGFADIDGKGIEGIERSMNDLLVGGRTTVAGIRDAAGRITLADGTDGVQPGANVTLTVHRSIQFIAERALKRAVHGHDAKSGTVVVLDVATSEVLAAASWPTYDPNAPAADARRGARNRAVTDAYEIGSTIKVFTVSAALDSGAVTPETEFNTHNGHYRVGRKVIKDSFPDKSLTVAGIIKRSSNVGTVKIAQLLGRENLYRAFVRYGLGRKTGIELPGERRGVLRPPKRWSEIELATSSFGYSLTSTALQVAAGFAAIGNDGVYNEPRIIKMVRDASGIAYEHRPIGRRIMKRRTARQMRAMLASVFDRGRHPGTARSLVVEGYHTGGKTGTAYKVDPATRQYSNELYLSSFAGLAPIDKPRIAIMVVIDQPRAGEYYGAQVAGPVFASVASETLRYLGVPLTKPLSKKTSKKNDKTDQKAAAKKKAKKLTPAEKAAAADLAAERAYRNPIADTDEGVDDTRGPREGAFETPDFKGMSMASALARARRAGISVTVKGSGRVVAQDPPPGWGAKPSECRLLFSNKQ